MTPEEAIRRNEVHFDAKACSMELDDYKAGRLGIEALKRVLLERKLGTYEMNYNLPGETEE